MKYLVIVFAAIFLGGCDLIIKAQTPQISGTWAGHIVSIAVVTTDGKKINVTGLEIDSGPSIPAPVRENDPGWHPVPILTNRDSYAYGSVTTAIGRYAYVAGSASQWWTVMDAKGRLLKRIFDSGKVVDACGTINVSNARDAHGHRFNFQVVNNN